MFTFGPLYFSDSAKKTPLNQNYGKTFTSKIQAEKTLKRQVRSYIKWGTKRALSLYKNRGNMEMYPTFLPFQHTQYPCENEEPLHMKLAKITEKELKILILKSEAEYLQNFKA